jgi:hypothetical protein
MICTRIEACKEGRTQALETFRERGKCRSLYKVSNPSGQMYHRIDFEQCVYEGRNADTRCDFGVLRDREIIYIELKGGNVKHGLEQLIATIDDTSKCFVGLNRKARLVVTKSPGLELLMAMPEYITLAKRVNGNRTNRNLIVMGTEFTEGF